MVLRASAFVAIRSAGGHFAPGALALGRLLVASLALGVVWLLSGGGWPTRAAWPVILGSGLLWFGLYMVTLNWGERDVDPGTAAMLVNIGPILLALLGGWLLHEGFPRRLAAGMAVSFGGVLVVGISESDAVVPRSSAWCCAWLRPSAMRPGWCARSWPCAMPRPSRSLRSAVSPCSSGRR